jgi:wyosine [tRNA(Phe)-imidazoG37] synthetase (radical SAM superfamily)
VNVVPPKICSLDCVYCEVGPTTALTIKRAPYIKADAVLAAFDESYPLVSAGLDVVTVTGAGEPTLNSELALILEGLKKRTELPIAILTNSTLLTNPEVAETLSGFDIVVPSLDAVLTYDFERVDKPAKGLDIAAISSALADFSHKYQGKLFLELLLVKGMNDSPAALKAFAEAAKRIKYNKIQVGTVFRPPAWEADALSGQDLTAACEFLAALGLDVAPVGEFTGHATVNTADGAERQLLRALLKMRPVTVKDVADALSITLEEAEKLVKMEGVASRLHEGELYYGL